MKYLKGFIYDDSDSYLIYKAYLHDSRVYRKNHVASLKHYMIFIVAMIRYARKILK